MSLRSIRSGATAITEAGVLQFITDLLKLSGVFDVTAGQLLVSAGSGLSVNVATGRAYLLASGGNGYPVINDAAISNLSITANNSGNPRYSAIVLYKDLGASPNADDTNTTLVVSVDGTPAASPSYPTVTQIQAITGAGNPYIVLAEVLVNNGASSPTQIVDTRPSVAFRNDILNQDAWVPYSPSAGTTLYLDFSSGKKFQVNLPNGTVTLALLNVPLNPKSFDLRLTQPATGSGLVNFWAGLSWSNNSVPVLSVTNNKSDEFIFNFLSVTNDSTNTSEGVQVLQNV